MFCTILRPATVPHLLSESVEPLASQNETRSYGNQPNPNLQKLYKVPLHTRYLPAISLKIHRSICHSPHATLPPYPRNTPSFICDIRDQTDPTTFREAAS